MHLLLLLLLMLHPCSFFLQWNQPYFRNTLGLAGPLSDLHIYACDKPVTNWHHDALPLTHLLLLLPLRILLFA
jgi:hypothetical protein